MVYTVSITSQGQISIPAPIRRQLNLDKNKKALVRVEKNTIVMEPVEDLLDLKGFFKTKKKISSRKIREAFEQYLAEEAVKGLK